MFFNELFLFEALFESDIFVILILPLGGYRVAVDIFYCWYYYSVWWHYFFGIQKLF